MKHIKRLLFLAFLLLGVLGVVGCAALTVSVWIADARVSRTTDVVFDRLDGTLDNVHQRVDKVEQRVDEAALTVDDVHQSLEQFAKRQAVDRLSDRFDVDGKAERLAGMLERADGWIEASESSVEIARRAINLANQAGAAVETDSVDRLADELAALRLHFRDAIELVDRLREATAHDNDNEGGLVKQRLEQAAKLALRVVAALGVVQSRLEQLRDRIEVTKRELQSIEARTIRWIHTVAIVLTLLLVWMLAGQLALCRYAWLGLRD